MQQWGYLPGMPRRINVRRCVACTPGQGDDLTAPEKTGTSARRSGRWLRFPKSRRGNGGDGYHVTRPQQRRIPMPHFQLQSLHIAEISRVV